MNCLVYFCKNSWWDDRKARKVLLPLAFSRLDGCRAILINAAPPVWSNKRHPSAWHHSSAPMIVLTPHRRFPGQRWAFIRKLNQRIKWSLVKAHLPSTGKVIMVLSDPEDLYIARFAGRAGYRCWFDWTERWDLYIQAFGKEAQMLVNPLPILEEVDGVIAVSRELEKEAFRKGKPVFYLPNAVSDEFLTLLSKPALIPEPADYADIPRPRAVHVGSYNPAWINWSMLIAAAQRLPHISFCMIGGGHESGVPDLPANIHLLGRRKYEDLPPLLAHADLCLLLYHPAATSSGDPTKLYEYLASGKPIISTPHPCAENFKNFLRLVYKSDDFVEAVAEELKNAGNTHADDRRQSAAMHTWSLRARSLKERLFQ